jgi:hypothetical protein
MRLFSIILSSVVFLSMLVELSAQSTSCTLANETQIISSALTGFNGRSTEGPLWTDTSFTGIVASMYPGTVRYPAGTQANYWNWRTGTFIEGSGKTAQYAVPIEDFLNGLPKETEIIYVMNMARPTPITGVPLDAPYETLASEATLNLKIADMFDALNMFNQLGRFPDALELGNEFYFSNEHATIYAANPTLYLNHANIISDSVKKKYPDLKILLCTTKGGSASRDYWNNTVFDFLAANEDFASRIYSVVQHHYINGKYGNTQLVTDTESAKLAIAEGFMYPREKASDIAIIPDGLKLCLTEYGVTKLNAENTWVAGLRSVAMTMGWMEYGNVIDRLLYHHITDHADVVDRDQVLPGPIAVAFGLLGESTLGQTHLDQVIFSNNPVVSNTSIESLHGIKVYNSSEENVFILNIADDTYANVDLNSLFNYNGGGIIKQYWTSEPYSEFNYLDGSLSEVIEQSSKIIDIHPFSVTKVSFTNDGLSTKEKLNDNQFKVFPSVFTDEFHVIYPDNEHRQVTLEMYSLDGKLVHSTQLANTGTVKCPSMPSGFYIVSLRGSDKNENHILIKK